MSLPAEIIEQLKKLPADKPVMCQVVDQHGRAWNMQFEFHDVPGCSMIQLAIFHPDLKKLPEIVFGGGQPYPNP